jgi:hypothetical protein
MKTKKTVHTLKNLTNKLNTAQPSTKSWSVGGFATI